MKVLFVILCLTVAAAILPACTGDSVSNNITFTQESPPVAAMPDGPIRKLLESGSAQTKVTLNYTQDYFNIPYPNGDVPKETGACTDVVIRAFRNAGIDLQKEVHEDMRANFGEYPNKWGLTKTDTNIDHRRVPNLQKYFARKGKSLPVTDDPSKFKPGDVVSWDLNGKGMTHIGLISNLREPDSGRYLIIHNIGSGTRIEDRLFEWTITGHFRYF